MTKARKKVDLTIIGLVVLALMLVPVVLYPLGYFWLAVTDANDRVIVRGYRSKWQATVYEPASRAESFLTGRKVWVTYTEIPGPSMDLQATP